jgi:protein-tyrosine phosphatase
MLEDHDDQALIGRNVRSLGGLRARGDLVVAPGRFFRGSSPAVFNHVELQALARLNLRTIIDLRTSGEVQNSRIDTESGVAVVHLPVFEVIRPNWIAPSDQTPDATATRYLEMLSDGLGAVAAIVTNIVRLNAPFLVSCSAGRDRTGIVVACLLDLVGVSAEAIARDYAASDFFAPETGRAHAATMLRLLTLVQERFGSTSEMLVSVGLDADTIAAFRWQLLVRTDKATP